MVKYEFEMIIDDNENAVIKFEDGDVLNYENFTSEKIIDFICGFEEDTSFLVTVGGCTINWTVSKMIEAFNR